MRARVSLATLLSVVALGACSSDTAIVLSIHAVDTQAEGTTRLEVYFGSGAVAPPASDALFPAAWWRRAVVEPQTVALDAVLGPRTYELSLTPASGIALDAEVMFAVAAYADLGDGVPQLIGFAHSDEFIRFGQGEIRRIDVPLHDYDVNAKEAGVTDSGCAWWNASTRAGPAQDSIRDRAIVPLGDRDCDGYRGDVASGCQLAGDCNDDDPSISPGAVQGCSTADTDCCDQSVADLRDADGDGVKVCEGDCVDQGGEPDLFGQTVPAAQIHPGQPDASCNGVDEACKRTFGGGCDSDVADPDDDGYVTCRFGANLVGSVRQSSCETFTVPDCLEVGMVRGVPASEIHPEADDTECDGVDQNCDRRCDEGGERDGDQDGFARCNNTGVVDMSSLLPTCGLALGDCDDNDPWRRPGSVEACDGIDSACDGVFSTGHRACLPITTATGQCTLGNATCTEVADGQASFGPCQAIPGGPVLADSFCRPCTTGTDPLQCNDGRFEVCGIHTMPTTGTTACAAPPQEVVLGDCPGCAWTIENGTAVNGWVVSLIAPNAPTNPTTPQATLTGNNAALRALTTGPIGQGFVIKRITEGGLITFEVIYLQHSQQTCGLVMCGG